MKWFLPLFLLLTNTVWAVDNVIGTASNNVLLDNASRKWDANVFYTTDGNGNVLTLLDQSLVSDSVSGLDGNNYFTDNAGRVWQANVCYTTDGNGNVVPITGGGGAGTVTSVGLSLPNIFSVSGSPITTFGTLTSSLANQSANTVFAGPSTGLSATPSFRALVAADIPSVSASKITSGQGSISSTTTGVTVTNGSNATVGPNTTVNIQTASGSQPGLLSSTDWTTFNNKQPAGNYITALTGDVTASGPGSAVSSLKSIAQEVWVDVGSGSDSNTGTITSKWLTVQHACNTITPSINLPVVIHISGGNNDTVVGHDVYPITCPPNITVKADYGIQLHGITITGGSTNDGVNFENILFLDPLTFVRNDSSVIGMTLHNVTSFGLVDFEQQGAGTGSSTFTAIGANNTFVGGITLQAGLAVMQTSGLIDGVLNYKDSGSALLFITGADLFGTTLQLHGGITAELAGNISDSGYTISGTTTGSGTPLIITDSSSVPASITGSFTTRLTSLSQYIDFTKGALIGSTGAPTSTNVLLEVKDGHSKSSQTTAPTTTVSANAGTGASCAVSNATDSAGIVTITFGTASFSSGAQCTINFNKAYGVAPICTFSPHNAQAAADSASVHQVYFTSTTGTAVVNFGQAQNSASVVDSWNYQCMETQ